MSRVLPLAGRLWEIIEERAKARRLDCIYVFIKRGERPVTFGRRGRPHAGLGRFVEREREPNGKRQRKKYEGLLFHDLRRSAARNMSRAGVGD